MGWHVGLSPHLEDGCRGMRLASFCVVGKRRGAARRGVRSTDETAYARVGRMRIGLVTGDDTVTCYVQANALVSRSAKVP